MGTEKRQKVYALKPGDLVRFIKEQWPRKSIHDTGIMEWKVGILVDIRIKTAYVFSDGQIWVMGSNELQKIG